MALTGLERDWPEIFGFTFLLDSLARLRLAQGRAPEALNLARECARRQRAWGFRNPGFVAFGSTLAAAAHATGRTEEALDAADEQADWAERFGVAREHGLALLALGAHHRRRRQDPRAPPRCWPARRRGSRTRTRSPTSATASPCAPRWSSPSAAARPRSPTRARDALVEDRRQAAPRRADRRRGADRRQERVARLAAGGLGNRDIAELLFVTEKTVEGHLGAAYRKLGIASRSQLSDALRTDPDAAA